MSGLKKLTFIQEFIKAYIDYHEGDPKIVDGEPTDAELLKEALPELKHLIQDPQGVDDIKDEVWLKNYVYSKVREAKESVDPHVKYMVVDTGLTDEAGITDDYQKAFEAALHGSRDDHSTYLLRVSKADDGSWKTYIDEYFSDGEWIEGVGKGREYLHFNCREYLHFNYIEETVGTKKI